eukprot:CAMPEP_0174704474 /NCGR_PEP_ID=MMETSP1094-20130205/8057_1 /TAXON_ID=156173 /ORGANISM="Chrysochromulina brevifilum, Strain UTEX LB 985" /LENGTH=2563 /DNA_ID=CAMNT_0015902535 /DNA_START=134 /DNA_END=7825 /DNA_ORIENTATION=+
MGLLLEARAAAIAKRQSQAAASWALQGLLMVVLIEPTISQALGCKPTMTQDGNPGWNCRCPGSPGEQQYEVCKAQGDTRLLEQKTSAATDLSEPWPANKDEATMDELLQTISIATLAGKQAYEELGPSLKKCVLEKVLPSLYTGGVATKAEWLTALNAGKQEKQEGYASMYGIEVAGMKGVFLKRVFKTDGLDTCYAGVHASHGTTTVLRDRKLLELPVVVGLYDSILSATDGGLLTEAMSYVIKDFTGQFTRVNYGNVPDVLTKECFGKEIFNALASNGKVSLMVPFGSSNTSNIDFVSKVISLGGTFEVGKLQETSPTDACEKENEAELDWKLVSSDKAPLGKDELVNAALSTWLGEQDCNPKCKRLTMEQWQSFNVQLCPGEGRDGPNAEDCSKKWYVKHTTAGSTSTVNYYTPVSNIAPKECDKTIGWETRTEFAPTYPLYRGIFPVNLARCYQVGGGGSCGQPIPEGDGPGKLKCKPLERTTCRRKSGCAWYVGQRSQGGNSVAGGGTVANYCSRTCCQCLAQNVEYYKVPMSNIGEDDYNTAKANSNVQHMWSQHRGCISKQSGSFSDSDLSKADNWKWHPASCATSDHSVAVTLSNPVAAAPVSIQSVFSADRINPTSKRTKRSRQAVTGWPMALPESEGGAPPEGWGLTVRQFVDFVEACKREPLWEVIKYGSRREGHLGYNTIKSSDIVNNYDVDLFFVKPWTKGTGEGVALNMNTDAYKKAEVFISHAWGEDIEQIKDMLWEWATKQGKEDAVIWFCTFSNYQADEFDRPYQDNELDQPTGPKPLQLGPTVKEQVFMDAFENVIEYISKTDPPGKMLALQVSEADMYTRLWCILEMDTALKMNVQTSLLTSMRYDTEYLSGYLELRDDEEALSKHWESLRTRTEDAKTGLLSDNIMIQMKILDVPADNNPFAGVDDTLTGFNPETRRYSDAFVKKLNDMYYKNPDKRDEDEKFLWDRYSQWWEQQKRAPRFVCMNERVQAWRQHQFWWMIERLNSATELPTSQVLGQAAVLYYANTAATSTLDLRDAVYTDREACAKAGVGNLAIVEPLCMDELKAQCSRDQGTTLDKVCFMTQSFSGTSKTWAAVELATDGPEAFVQKPLSPSQLAVACPQCGHAVQDVQIQQRIEQCGRRLTRRSMSIASERRLHGDSSRRKAAALARPPIDATQEQEHAAGLNPHHAAGASAADPLLFQHHFKYHDPSTDQLTHYQYEARRHAHVVMLSALGMQACTATQNGSVSILTLVCNASEAELLATLTSGSIIVDDGDQGCVGADGTALPTLRERLLTDAHVDVGAADIDEGGSAAVAVHLETASASLHECFSQTTVEFFQGSPQGFHKARNARHSSLAANNEAAPENFASTEEVIAAAKADASRRGTAQRRLFGSWNDSPPPSPPSLPAPPQPPLECAQIKYNEIPLQLEVSDCTALQPGDDMLKDHCAWKPAEMLPEITLRVGTNYKLSYPDEYSTPATGSLQIAIYVDYGDADNADHSDTFFRPHTECIVLSRQTPQRAISPTGRNGITFKMPELREMPCKAQFPHAAYPSFKFGARASDGCTFGFASRFKLMKSISHSSTFKALKAPEVLAMWGSKDQHYGAEVKCNDCSVSGSADVHVLVRTTDYNPLAEAWAWANVDMKATFDVMARAWGTLEWKKDDVELIEDVCHPPLCVGTKIAGVGVSLGLIPALYGGAFAGFSAEATVTYRKVLSTNGSILFHSKGANILTSKVEGFKQLSSGQDDQALELELNLDAKVGASLKPQFKIGLTADAAVASFDAWMRFAVKLEAEATFKFRTLIDLTTGGTLAKLDHFSTACNESLVGCSDACKSGVHDTELRIDLRLLFEAGWKFHVAAGWGPLASNFGSGNEFPVDLSSLNMHVLLGGWCYNLMDSLFSTESSITDTDPSERYSSELIVTNPGDILPKCYLDNPSGLSVARANVGESQSSEAWSRCCSLTKPQFEAAMGSMKSTSFRLNTKAIDASKIKIRKMTGYVELDNPLSFLADAWLIREFVPPSLTDLGRQTRPEYNRAMSMAVFIAIDRMMVAMSSPVRSCDQNSVYKKATDLGKTSLPVPKLSRQMADLSPHSRKTGLVHLENITLYMMVDQFVFPVTRHSAAETSSFAELLPDTNVGSPDYMVSHFWGEPHRRFVRSLRLHEMVFELQANYGKTKYWVCAYANNQHEVTAGFPSIDQAPFASAIEQAKGFVLLLDEHMQPLTRIWCLFETHKVIIERRRFSVSTGAFLFKAWDPDVTTGKFPATKNWETFYYTWLAQAQEVSSSACPTTAMARAGMVSPDNLMEEWNPLPSHLIKHSVPMGNWPVNAGCKDPKHEAIVRGFREFETGKAEASDEGDLVRILHKIHTYCHGGYDASECLSAGCQVTCPELEGTMNDWSNEVSHIQKMTTSGTTGPFCASRAPPLCMCNDQVREVRFPCRKLDNAAEEGIPAEMDPANQQGTNYQGDASKYTCMDEAVSPDPTKRCPCGVSSGQYTKNSQQVTPLCPNGKPPGGETITSAGTSIRLCKVVVQESEALEYDVLPVCAKMKSSPNSRLYEYLLKARLGIS